MLTITRLAEIRRKTVSATCKELQKEFKITQQAVFQWKQKGIPEDRQIDIVKRFHLDPIILIRGDADDSVSQDPAE